MYALASVRNQSAEPRWQDWRRLDRARLPQPVRSWLLDEGSLTERLIRASGNRFRVRVRAQGWERPLPSERRALALPDAQRALVREVVLECGGEPWVFARSIVPAATLTGRLRHLRRFGARSLGALLFATPGIERAPFEVTQLPAGHRLLPRELAVDRPVWGRRSVFRLHGRPLLVQEIFLPACRIAPERGPV